MINHRNKQNYRFRTWKFRDRCHLKGGVRQGCFLSLILNNLIQYIHFHSLYITSHYYAKFKENPCVGTDARPPLKLDGKLYVFSVFLWEFLPYVWPPVGEPKTCFLIYLFFAINVYYFVIPSNKIAENIFHSNLIAKQES